MRETFTQASAVHERHRDGDRASFSADLHPGWGVGGRPNGGYLLAVLGRAVAATGRHPDVVAVSAHFLRPPATGPADVELEVLHEGRSVSTVRASLRQEGRTCVEALVTTGDLDRTAPVWRGEIEPPAVAAMEDCTRLVAVTDAFEVPLMDQLDLRLDPGSMGWTVGAPTGRGELLGRIALLDEPAFDPLSLLVAVDAFPPAPFDVEVTGWVPTIQLSAYVRARPADGPVVVRHRAQVIAQGRVDETTTVWDRNGAVVAQGTQLAGIRLAPR
ncbi:MAG: thioesterase family protein [Nocardioides sp.]|nr:thioesterase family protein [Nocardioides sp.]